MARVPLQISRDCVIASIQVDLSREVLEAFREELLDLLHSSGATGVILDVSGVEILDHEDFQALNRTMAMARLMGARSVISGLRAGVVSSLVDLGAETDDIVAALDLDDAYRLLEEGHGEESDSADEADCYEQLYAAPENP